MKGKIGVLIIAMLVIASFVASVSTVCADDEPLKKPDLRPWSCERNTGPFNYEANITITVYNGGNKTAFAPWWDKIVWDEGTPGAAVLGYHRWNSDIPSYSWDDYYFEFRAQWGLHSITVHVDWYNDIDEWDEDNNVRTFWFLWL